MPDATQDMNMEPLAGVLTPQTLAMARLAQFQQAQAQAGQLQGRDYAARIAGLGAGQMLSTAGGPPNTPLDRLAQSNQDVLNATPMPTGGEGSGGFTTMDSQGNITPAQQSTVSPLEAQAQVWDMRAKMFAARGQAQAAQAMTDKANALRKLDAGIQKDQAEKFKFASQGEEAQGHLWSTPTPGINPEGKRDTFQVGPGGVVRWTGATPQPQVPTASITLKEAQPFIQNYAKTLDTYFQGANKATLGLTQLANARNLLDSGNLVLGTGADARLKLDTLLATAGIKSADPKVSNTQAFISATNEMALNSRTSGFSRITNFDLDFLKSINAAKPEDLTPQAVARVFDIRQKVMEGQINQYNNTLQAARNTAASATDPATRDAFNLATSIYTPQAIPNSGDVQTMTPQEATDWVRQHPGQKLHYKLPSGTHKWVGYGATP